MAVHFVSPDPGAVMQEIRFRVVELFWAYFSEGGSFEYFFGTTAGKQSVTLQWDLGDFGAYEYVFICGQLDSGDVMPFKAMIQCPGFDDWCTMERWADNTPSWTYGQVLTYWKASVADIKQEMINTWSSGSPRTIIYDNADVVSGEIESHIAIIPTADNDGIYVARDALYIGSVHGGGGDEYIYKSNSSGMPGGVGGANFNTSGIVKALEDLSMTGYQISFNHGGTIFSAWGNLIVG
jgi:hypothetical protein